MFSEETKQFLEVSADFVTTFGITVAVIGLLVAIFTYRAERKKEIIERENSTFEGLDDKYVEFMYKCSQYPNLDLFSTPADSNREASEEDIKIEEALYSVLISIFERAFLMFEKTYIDEELRKRQYEGWKICMRSYCTRRSFLSEWKRIGCQFDKSFYEAMTKMINEELQKKNITK